MAQRLKIETEEDAIAFLALAKQYAEIPPINFLDGAFPAQDKFLQDKSHRRAALCTRRAGKSYGIGKSLFKDALETDGSNIMYLGLTADSAMRIMWQPILKVINDKMKIGAKFDKASRTVTTPNGSIIWLMGGDSNRSEMDKVLGGKVKRLVIDEAGSFRQDLNKFVYEIAEPALADYDGCVDLVGTPTDLLNTLFHKATTFEEPGWSVHKWSAFDNPYIKDNWRKRIDRMIAENPRIVETPAYKRMYLGEWWVDTDKLVYKYDRARNFISELPEGTYTNLLGVDLGYNDDTAFVLGGYRPHDRNLYLRRAWSKPQMTLTDVEQILKQFIQEYGVTHIVIDGANKQAVKELEFRMGISLIPAEKTGKADYIEIMNSDFIQGYIKLLPEAESLGDEYAALIWDDKAILKRIEHPNCKNHKADAALYLHRFAYSYLAQPAPVKLTEVDREEELEDRIASKMERNSKKNFLERDWDDDFGF